MNCYEFLQVRLDTCNVLMGYLLVYVYEAICTFLLLFFPIALDRVGDTVHDSLPKQLGNSIK